LNLQGFEYIQKIEKIIQQPMGRIRLRPSSRPTCTVRAWPTATWGAAHSGGSGPRRTACSLARCTVRWRRRCGRPRRWAAWSSDGSSGNREAWLRKDHDGAASSTEQRQLWQLGGVARERTTAARLHRPSDGSSGYGKRATALAAHRG
jgi:hypothetical protein